MAEKKKWIQDAIKPQNRGSLRKALHVSEGQKIPAKKLAVKSTDSPKMAKRKNLAKTLRGFD